MVKQNTASKSKIEWPKVFITLFLIAGFECVMCFLSGRVNSRQRKRLRMIISAGGRELASRWLTQTGEMKTMIEKLIFVKRLNKFPN